MKSFIATVLYRSLKSQSYTPVATVHVPSTLDTLECVFDVLNGQEAASGVRVYYKYNPQTLRSMSIGDIVEIAGAAFVCANTGFAKIELRRDHQYPMFYSSAETLLRQLHISLVPPTGANAGPTTVELPDWVFAN